MRNLFFWVLLFLFLTPNSILGQQQSNQMTVYATLTDKKGKPISGLKSEDFQLSEGKDALEIVSVDDTDAPMSIGFLIDASESMTRFDKRNNRISWARQGIIEFLKTANRKNEYFVFAFNEQLRLLKDFTQNVNEISQVVNDDSLFETNRGTKSVDAAYAALNKLAIGKYQKRVLILITDEGFDNESSYDSGELDRAVNQSNILFYTVSILLPTDGVTVTSTNELEKMSVGTGGAIFFPTDFITTQKALMIIGEEIKKQYSIVFNLNPISEKSKLSRKFLKLTVSKELRKKYDIFQVKVRKGYFPIAEVAEENQK